MTTTERDVIAQETEEMQKRQELAAEQRKKESYDLVAESIRRELVESKEFSSLLRPAYLYVLQRKRRSLFLMLMILTDLTQKESSRLGDYGN